MPANILKIAQVLENIHKQLNRIEDKQAGTITALTEEVMALIQALESMPWRLRLPSEDAAIAHGRETLEKYD